MAAWDYSLVAKKAASTVEQWDWTTDCKMVDKMVGLKDCMWAALKEQSWAEWMVDLREGLMAVKKVEWMANSTVAYLAECLAELWVEQTDFQTAARLAVW